jgi:hypothetical protein
MHFRKSGGELPHRGLIFLLFSSSLLLIYSLILFPCNFMFLFLNIYWFPIIFGFKKNIYSLPYDSWNKEKIAIHFYLDLCFFFSYVKIKCISLTLGTLLDFWRNKKRKILKGFKSSRIFIEYIIYIILILSSRVCKKVHQQIFTF